MPVVNEQVRITSVFGEPRDGFARHTFVRGNFFMQRMLNRYRDALEVVALPHELAHATDHTIEYLQSRAATLRVTSLTVGGDRLRADIAIDNLNGHKLPTAYPSRRAWLHLVVRDGKQPVVFESGALNRPGSIVGNDNDADASKFEPHYSDVTDAEQVQIYESILGDANGGVTTGLLTATGYLKDNRLLPRGFDKQTAATEIAVHGGAIDDADFTNGGDRVRYSVPPRRGGTVHDGRGASLSADWLPVGQQSQTLRCRRTTPIHVVLRFDVVRLSDDARQGGRLDETVEARSCKGGPDSLVRARSYLRNDTL